MVETGFEPARAEHTGCLGSEKTFKTSTLDQAWLLHLIFCPLSKTILGRHIVPAFDYLKIEL